MRTPISDLHAGIDWLTFTYSDVETQKEVEEWARTKEQADLRRGEPSIAMSSYGYQGWTCSGLRFGKREDGSILSASSGRAEEFAQQAIVFGGKCTRVDLQVTAKLIQPEQHMGRRLYSRLIMTTEQTPQKQNTLIENSKGGETLYIGARISEQMGRVYDKSAQAGIGPVGESWRYEVEFKGKRAPVVWSHLTREDDRAKLIASTVWEWFNSHGVSPVWDRGTWGVKLEVPARVQTVEQQLMWLRQQVKPTVGRLVKYGFAEQVWEALGIKEE